MSTEKNMDLMTFLNQTKLAKKNDIVTVEEEEMTRYVTFEIGGEEYAIDITLVVEIIRITSITPVPLSYDFVSGVINLRGNIVPIIDLNRKFKIERQGKDKDQRLIVVEIGKKIIGFKVDKVNEVISLGTANIDPTPSLVSSLSRKYIYGVGKIDDRIIVLIEIEKLLSEDELERLASNQTVNEKTVS
jgi:purine-binding chemotaxis protein CheW